MNRTNAHRYLWQELCLPEILEQIDEVGQFVLTDMKPWLYHEIDDTLHYLRLRQLELELGIKIDETLCDRKHDS